jgi:hypothetical protein
MDVKLWSLFGTLPNLGHVTVIGIDRLHMLLYETESSCNTRI